MSPEFLTYSDLTLKKKVQGWKFTLMITHYIIQYGSPLNYTFHPNRIENDYGSNVTILSICNEQRDLKVPLREEINSSNIK